MPGGAQASVEIWRWRTLRTRGAGGASTHWNRKPSTRRWSTTPNLPPDLTPALTCQGDRLGNTLLNSVPVVPSSSRPPHFLHLRHLRHHSQFLVVPTRPLLVQAPLIPEESPPLITLPPPPPRRGPWGPPWDPSHPLTPMREQCLASHPSLGAGTSPGLLWKAQRYICYCSA